MSRTILTRPDYSNEVVDGTYNGEIVSVSVERMDSRFKAGEQYDALAISCHVHTESGPLQRKYFISVSWQEDKPLHRFLRAFGCLPEAGEDVDLGQLVGREVTVDIANEKKSDGNIYANIVAMRPRKPTSNGKVAGKKKSAPQVEQDDDFDSLFDDEDED